MSKSRRVFLSIQGNDNFWGNGDREERMRKSKSRVVEDDEDEKYFFKKSQQRMHQIQEQEGEEGEDEEGFEEMNWKMCKEYGRSVETGREMKRMFGADHNPFDAPEKVVPKPKIAPFEPTETFYSNYRSFFRSRPEVRSLILSIDETAPDTYDNKFIELYEKTRRKVETFPDAQSNQILRRTCHSITPIPAEQRTRNRQAVVVSNFREPDRRLGRYSKYYYHHNVGPEVYSRKVFVGGLPTFVTEEDMIHFFSRFGRLQVDWPSKHFGSLRSDSDPSVYNEQIVTFASDDPVPPPVAMSNSNSFNRQSTGGGFSNPGGFQPQPIRASEDRRFGSMSPKPPSFGGSNPGSNSNLGGFSNPGRVSNTGFSFAGSPRPPAIDGGRFACLADPSPRKLSIEDEYDQYGDSGFGVRGDLDKKPQHIGYVFLLFENEHSVRDLVGECFEEEEGLFITLESGPEPTRVQIRPWLLADAEFLMDFNVPINTKLVAFIGGVPRPLKAVELAHFFEQTYGNVVCVGIDIDNKFKYPRGSGRVAFSNYDAYVQAITDRYIILDHDHIHKRVEIKPYFFHNQSCEECSGRFHRQHAPYFCPSLECFQYYCEPCWEKMHAHPSRFHHQPVVKGI